ncbi:hypothetical protein ES703_70953 [subsurface metagenome]
MVDLITQAVSGGMSTYQEPLPEVIAVVCGANRDGPPERFLTAIVQPPRARRPVVAAVVKAIPLPGGFHPPCYRSGALWWGL